MVKSTVSKLTKPHSFSLKTAYVGLVVFMCFAMGCGGSTALQSITPSQPSTPPVSNIEVNDPGITYDNSFLTIKANVSSNLTNGSFGAAIQINDGPELFFYGAGDVAGNQEFKISKSDLELQLGQSLSNGTQLKVRAGYSNQFPSSTVSYTGAKAKFNN